MQLKSSPNTKNWLRNPESKGLKKIRISDSEIKRSSFGDINSNQILIIDFSFQKSPNSK